MYTDSGPCQSGKTRMDIGSPTWARTRDLPEPPVATRPLNGSFSGPEAVTLGRFSAGGNFGYGYGCRQAALDADRRDRRQYRSAGSWCRVKRTTAGNNGMKHLGKTPPFRRPKGEPIPGSIAEVNYLRLGGLDQWVMIRGENITNPPLILLHGGPGFTEMRLFRHFNAPLEKSFTVVHWDQRGAGKSFDRKISKSSMTVEQFIADLDELVEAVCKRVGDRTRSRSSDTPGDSALGVLYAARFPEKVAAYVGSGQIGDWPARRGVIVCLRARRGAASQQPQGPEGAARHRPAAPHRQQLVDGAHVAPALRRATRGRKPCGIWDESFSAGRNHRSSICPTSCVVSGSLSTRCGLKCRR